MSRDGARVRCPRCNAADAMILFRSEVACQNPFCVLYAQDLVASSEEEERRRRAAEEWRRACLARAPVDPWAL